MPTPRRDREDTARSRWGLNRLKLATAIRRSNAVSDGAFRLWSELAFGWAWDEPTCYPTYATLCEALNVCRTTIYVYLEELESLGLLKRTRQRRGSRFSLADTLPDGFSTPSNKLLASRAKAMSAKAASGRRSQKKDTRDVQNPEHQEPVPAVCDVQNPEHCDVQNPEHHGQFDVQDSEHQVRCDVQNPEHKVLDVHKYISEEKYRKLKYSREPVAPALKTGGSSEPPSRFALGNEDTEDGMAEAEDLLGEVEEPKSNNRRRRPRAASKDLVSGESSPRKIPFPEALRASQIDAKRFSGAEITPPAVESAEDLVWLLRGEIEERWGKRATRSFPHEPVAGELKGKIENTVIRKYTPDVILAMVRLIVWDWHVARGSCFPYRPDVPYPDIHAFVQYAKELAARIDSGFDYSTKHRGSLNTYKALFIDKKPKMDDAGPQWL